MDWHSIHKHYMFDILKVIYQSDIGKYLWFKWWTALYFLYWLDRFSVDLDFNLTKDLTQDKIQEIKTNMIEKLQYSFRDEDIKVKQEWTLTNSFRLVLQYWWLKKIKIEVNSAIYPDKYEIKTVFWLPVQIMKIEYMFAHKLCALYSRYLKNETLANRDLFDIYFLFKKWFKPNEEIIKIRTKKMISRELSVEEYYKFLYDFLKSKQQEINKNILDWLWELIDQNKKNFVKNEMLEKIFLYLGNK